MLPIPLIWRSNENQLTGFTVQFSALGTRDYMKADYTTKNVSTGIVKRHIILTDTENMNCLKSVNDFPSSHLTADCSQSLRG
jgi:hypothetical protein